MGGGTTVKVPGPSAGQENLMAQQSQFLQMQSDILNQQLQQQQLLAPLMFKAAGITPIMGANGQIVGFAQQTDSLAEQGKLIQQKLNEKTLAALAGKLPDNPALLSDLATQEQTLNEQLLKQLGPGYKTSTPAAGPGGALTGFMQAKTNILDAARRGDLSVAQSLGLAQQMANQQLVNSKLQNLGGISGFQFGQPGASTIGNMFAQAQAPFMQQSGFGFGANSLNAQLNAQNQMAMMAGLGQLGGLALFSPWGGTGPGQFTTGIGSLASLFKSSPVAANVGAM